MPRTLSLALLCAVFTALAACSGTASGPAGLAPVSAIEADMADGAQLPPPSSM